MVLECQFQRRLLRLNQAAPSFGVAEGVKPVKKVQVQGEAEGARILALRDFAFDRVSLGFGGLLPRLFQVRCGGFQVLLAVI